MPSIESWSFKPLDVIQSFFENRKENINWTEQVEKYFSERLKDHSMLKTIQSLNDISTQNLRPNALVHFRCMIQETFEPEYFMESFEMVHKLNKTKNDYELTENAANPTSSRQILYCVTVPGETFWVKEKHLNNQRFQCTADAASSTVRSEKRSLEDDDFVDQGEPMSTEDDNNKRQKISTSQEDKSPLLPLKKNHPLPDEDGPVCIVKVYGKERDFKVNEIYEFVGVLSMDSSLAQLSNEVQDNGVDSEMIEEHRAHHPPPSFVPRLHCVHMIKLNHINPLISSIDHSGSHMSNIRNEVISFLRKATLGDELAAEYLLLHLVSRVYSRTGAMAVGKFSLNLSNIPENTKYSVLLSQFLKHLLTKVFYFPMTLENLNKNTFIPAKNYTTNRLDSGILQLSDGTDLIVDETLLNAGHLDSNGVKNVQALTNLINFQKVDYNFQFHPLSFEHDLPVLVLSNGKSLLPCDVQVPLTPKMDIPVDLSQYFESLCPTPDELDMYRIYLTRTQLLEYELNESMMKVIENDFVAARRESDDKMTADDLHRHLIVARLVSITSDMNHLTRDVWKTVKELEMDRKTRLA